MKESLLKNYGPIVSWFASWDAIMSTSLLWPLHDKQERWAICTGIMLMRMLARACVCPRPTNVSSCLDPNDGATILARLCTSHGHRLFRIILACEYHIDKVKLDISTGGVYVCARGYVCVREIHTEEPGIFYRGQRPALTLNRRDDLPDNLYTLKNTHKHTH